jgi:hypothetical protein
MNVQRQNEDGFARCQARPRRPALFEEGTREPRTPRDEFEALVAKALASADPARALAGINKRADRTVAE